LSFVVASYVSSYQFKNCGAAVNINPDSFIELYPDQEKIDELLEGIDIDLRTSKLTSVTILKIEQTLSILKPSKLEIHASQIIWIFLFKYQSI
jgi:hypothetical protein